MFAPRYFAVRSFAPTYFPPGAELAIEEEVTPAPKPVTASVGSSSPRDRVILQLYQPLQDDLQNEALVKQVIQEDNELLQIIPLLIKSGIIQ